MPRREDIHKIMVIGSGPIVIGQAAEFDYAGSQACASLREEEHMEPVILGMSALIFTILIPFIGKFCNIITNNS